MFRTRSAEVRLGCSVRRLLTSLRPTKQLRSQRIEGIAQGLERRLRRALDKLDVLARPNGSCLHFRRPMAGLKAFLSAFQRKKPPHWADGPKPKRQLANLALLAGVSLSQAAPASSVASSWKVGRRSERGISAGAVVGGESRRTPIRVAAFQMAARGSARHKGSLRGETRAGSDAALARSRASFGRTSRPSKSGPARRLLRARASSSKPQNQPGSPRTVPDLSKSEGVGYHAIEDQHQQRDQEPGAAEYCEQFEFVESIAAGGGRAARGRADPTIMVRFPHVRLACGNATCRS